MDEYVLKSNETLSIIPFGDAHIGASTCDYDFLDYWKKVVSRIKGPRRIYCLGDMLEASAKNIGNAAFKQSMDLNEQKEYIIDLLYPLKDDIVIYHQGNHCFDEETELLTIDGFKTVHEYDGEKLGTMNKNTGQLEFQEPSEIFINYYDGLMKHFTNRQLDLLITPKHRLIYTYEGGKKEINKYRIDSVSDISNKEIFIPMSCWNNNQNYNISDEWLRLIAWCLTDSSYNDSNIIFYQRKTQVNRITDLLDSLGFEYGYRERDRNITHICGKKLKSKPEIGCEVTLYKKYADKVKARVSHYSVPDVLWKVSKEQFITFLEEMVFCDGSKHPSSPDSAWVLYKSKELLTQIQALCIKHNIRSVLKEYRKNTFRLNISLKHNGIRIKNQWMDVPYKGLVWCATVPNDTLICRRNGKVSITGNSFRLSKDFDYDIAKDMARELGVPYSMGGHIDKFSVNNKEYSIYTHHGKGSASRRDLAIGKIIRDTTKISADIFMVGHLHHAMVFKDYIKSSNGLEPKYYVYCGAFLNYKSSYADQMALNEVPPAFLIGNISKNHKIKWTEVDRLEWEQSTEYTGN